MDTARLGQSAELAALEHERKHAHSAHEKHPLDQQIKQIKHDHLGYQTLKASKYYDPEGRELGDIPAHTAVLINAGTLTTIKLHPNTNSSTQVAGPDASAGGVECAFVFETVDPADPKATRKSAGGWIPTSVLPPAACKEERSIASKIRKARDDKHDRFEAQPIPILTSTRGRNKPARSDRQVHVSQGQAGRQAGKAGEPGPGLSVQPVAQRPALGGPAVRRRDHAARPRCRHRGQGRGSASSAPAGRLPRVLSGNAPQRGADRPVRQGRHDPVGRDVVRLRLRADQRRRQDLRLDQQEDAGAVNLDEPAARRSAPRAPCRGRAPPPRSPLPHCSSSPNSRRPIAGRQGADRRCAVAHKIPGSEKRSDLAGLDPAKYLKLTSDLACDTRKAWRARTTRTRSRSCRRPLIHRPSRRQISRGSSRSPSSSTRRSPRAPRAWRSSPSRI